MVVGRGVSSSPVAVVWGHLKVFVNDVAQFDHVISVLAARAYQKPMTPNISDTNAVVATAELVQVRLSAHRDRNYTTLAKALTDVRGLLFGTIDAQVRSFEQGGQRGSAHGCS